MLKRSKMSALVGAVVCSGAALAAPEKAGAAEHAAPVQAYRMAAVVDRAHGRDLLAGDYASVIEALRTKRAYFEASNNLCVAYVMRRDLQNADAECTTALELSRSAAIRRDVAVALTNLGVLEVAHGDLSAARSHFSEALELQADLQPAVENLRLLPGDAQP